MRGDPMAMHRRPWPLRRAQAQAAGGRRRDFRLQVHGEQRHVVTRRTRVEHGELVAVRKRARANDVLCARARSSRRGRSTCAAGAGAGGTRLRCK